MRRLLTTFVLLLAVLPGAARAQPEAGVFSFERLNRVYDRLIDDLASIRIGPAEVTLRSPEHELTVVHHAAALAPGRDGVYEATLEMEIEGSGRIVADVVIGSLESQLDQQVTVPRQTVSLEGAIRVKRTQDGYWIRTERMPSATRVRIESELGTELAFVCRQMALVLVSLDCDAIERAVTLIETPLPAAGGEYLIGFEETTPEERAAFDRFLETLATGAAAP